MVNFSTVEILNVRVACLDFAGILQQIENWLSGSEKRTILYANAHSLNTACEDVEVLAALRQADLVYADGVSVVWAGRLLGGRRLVKMTGADWITPFCEWTQEQGASLYLFGGKAGVGRRAAEILLRRYPALPILGCADGYFQERGEAEVVREINRLRPQVLFVGLGTPQQEKWLAAHRSELDVQLCWGVGALFDYVAGYERRVPAWMYSMSLEWLWRLWVNPRGKWRRYILGNPLFAWRVLKQWMEARSRT